MRTFIVTLAAGSAWIPGKTSREQPFWSEHAAFMDDLFARGQILMGGPYADFSGVHLILLANDVEAVVELLLADPWQRAGLLQPPVINEWLVFLSVLEGQ